MPWDTTGWGDDEWFISESDDGAATLSGVGALTASGEAVFAIPGNGWDRFRWGESPWDADVGTSESPITYRLVLAERSDTGLGTPIVTDVLAEVGLPYGADTAIRWSRVLNGAGSLEFTAYIDTVTPDVYAPGQREVHLYRDDGSGELLVWGGHLWKADVDHDWVRFTALGWYEALRHREISTDFYRTSVDQFNIAWQLIDYTQDEDGGGLGITRFGVGGSGVGRTVLYCAEERQNIADAIEDLASADDGFDFDVTPNKRWRVWSPERGLDMSDTVGLHAESTVSELSYSIDATTVSNDVAGIGEGEDCEPIHFERARDEDSRALYGLMQSTVSRGDLNQDKPRITALAREELQQSKDAELHPTIRYPVLLDGPSPLTQDFGLGDVITLSASRGYATFNSPFRVLAYTITSTQTGREHVELELDSTVGIGMRASRSGAVAMTGTGTLCAQGVVISTTEGFGIDPWGTSSWDADDDLLVPGGCG